MKKIYVGLFASALFLNASAENWKPLAVNHSSPDDLSSSSVDDQVYTQPKTDQQLAPKQMSEAEFNKSLSLEYTAQKGKFENNIDADIKGGAIGISAVPTKNGIWSKFEFQKNDDYSADYYEASFGGQYNLVNLNGLYLTGTYGLGIGFAKVDGFDNSTFITVPVGLEAGYNFTPRFALFTGIGYKWAWDVSSSSTCNDGSSSNSVGSGTCSYHGGINHYNDNIGNFDGLTYKFGMRYSF